MMPQILSPSQAPRREIHRNAGNVKKMAEN